MNIIEAIAQKDMACSIIQDLYSKMPNSPLDSMIDNATWNDIELLQDQKEAFEMLISAKKVLWEDVTKELEILEKIKPILVK